MRPELIVGHRRGCRDCDQRVDMGEDAGAEARRDLAQAQWSVRIVRDVQPIGVAKAEMHMAAAADCIAATAWA